MKESQKVHLKNIGLNLYLSSFLKYLLSSLLVSKLMVDANFTNQTT
jgi:hypothetical protein